jgi:hypothetical protein
MTSILSGILPAFPSEGFSTCILNAGLVPASLWRFPEAESEIPQFSVTDTCGVVAVGFQYSGTQ